MSLKVKAFLFQLMCFAALFMLFRFLVDRYTEVSGIWIPFTAFVAGTLLSPKFQVARTKDGEKMYMSWLFMKGIHEIK